MEKFFYQVGYAGTTVVLAALKFLSPDFTTWMQIQVLRMKIQTIFRIGGVAVNYENKRL